MRTPFIGQMCLTSYQRKTQQRLDIHTGEIPNPSLSGLIIMYPVIIMLKLKIQNSRLNTKLGQILESQEQTRRVLDKPNYYTHGNPKTLCDLNGSSVPFLYATPIHYASATLAILLMSPSHVKYCPIMILLFLFFSLCLKCSSMR